MKRFLAESRYAVLRSYRRDGTPVDTPIWFDLDGDRLVFRTKIGPKTKRVAAHPRVEVQPCDHRGRIDQGAPVFGGTARLLDGAEADAANAALHRRYGWQYNIVALIKVPGVTNVHSALPLREKLRRAGNNGVWPDSAIVAVDLD